MNYSKYLAASLLLAGWIGLIPVNGQKSGKDRSRIDQTIPAAPPMGTTESYANGAIRGYWKFNHFNDDETGTYGHKTLTAAYDSLSNTVYILSDHRNVLTGPLKDSAALAMTNQKVVVNGDLFLGVVTRSNRFRLLGAIQPEWNNGGIHYSDDGGKSWVKSKGGDLADRDVRWSAVMEDPSRTILVMTVQPVIRASSRIERYALLESVDQGESFSPVSDWEEKDPVNIIACKPYNTNSCYFIRKLAQSNVWTVKEYDYHKHAFIPVAMHYSKKVPASFVGTRVNDTTYLYVGAKGGGYVSKDGGKTWKDGEIRERIAATDPVHPELLVEEAATGFVSKDGGKKWEHLPWWEKVFGWDLHSVKWFRTRDIGWVAVLNNDFGAHFTTNYTDSVAWKHLNTDNIHMILHHGAFDEGTGLLLTANQDRGTMIWEKEKDGYYKGNTVTKADGLRVTIADRGNSYWYIHYWNTIYHKLYRKGQREKVDSLVVDIPRVLKDTTWYTPPMQPSWKPGEDVIFMAGNSRIIRLQFDPYYNSINRMELPFNFQDSTDEVLAGLATCRANSDRMYACTKNGRFYRSNDLGKTWEKTAYAGPVPFVRNRPWWGPYGYCIETAPDDAAFVCWAGDGDSSNTFLISEDGGKTFTAATDGLPEGANIRDLAITPGGEYIFANNGYVYSRKDHKWYDMSGGSRPDGGEINSVEYLPKARVVRYFTYGVGVLDFVLTN